MGRGEGGGLRGRRGQGLSCRGGEGGSFLQARAGGGVGGGEKQQMQQRHQQHQQQQQQYQILRSSGGGDIIIIIIISSSSSSSSRGGHRVIDDTSLTDTQGGVWGGQILEPIFKRENGKGVSFQGEEQVRDKFFFGGEEGQGGIPP